MSDIVSTKKNNPEYYVGILSHANRHTCKLLKIVRGFTTLKKGMVFDYSFNKYECDGNGWMGEIVSDYNPETDSIEYITVYDPEI